MVSQGIQGELKAPPERLKNILVVEDDGDVAATIRNVLDSANLQATVVSTGAEAVRHLRSGQYALCIIDLGLPDIDGIELVREISNRHELGVIIVSGRTDRIDRVLGLELGADDFIAKPFDPRELLARIKSLSRRMDYTRQQAETRAVIAVFPTWRLDRSKREVTRDGDVFALASSEFRLLNILMDHPNRVLDRAFILDLIYGNANAPFDRSVDITVTRLRQKIEADPKHPQYIKTVRSEGYMFIPKPDGPTASGAPVLAKEGK